MGPDGINPRILQELADAITKPLSVFEQPWELAKSRLTGSCQRLLQFFQEVQGGPWKLQVYGGLYQNHYRVCQSAFGA